MKKRFLMVVFCMLAALPCPASGGKSSQGPPPASVAVTPIVDGVVEPVQEFVGSIVFAHVSRVAAEVAGKVEDVTMEEGRPVTAGQPLAVLGTDLLDLTIRKSQATLAKATLEKERAEKDLRRLETLSRENSIAVTVYEDQRTKALMLGQQVAALTVELDRNRLIRGKMTVYAPFSGIVIKRHLEKGEWVAAGSPVAVVAMDRVVDAVLNVPEPILGYLSQGMPVDVQSGGRTHPGRFFSVIPSGDVATRTFSIKIRLTKASGLMEGMTARVALPAGKAVGGLLAPRDAVIGKSGQDVVFVHLDGVAKMIPVTVLGYKGMMIGIAGPGLRVGMAVVIKGNERIRAGQPLKIVDNQMPGKQPAQ
ncbi:MAG: efflux RND transporter periplasmic adaptor subunit [Desulfobacterales bacterium]|nr:efflux RND transporter periplasmic adaptor subunit [Desulfobacterales bacterium]